MTTYKLALSADKKTVSVFLGADTAPGGSTALPSFDHAESDDPVHAHAPNHALWHHIRDTLYKRKASDGSSGALYPEGIYNMQEIKIVRHGPAINHEYLAAADVAVESPATPTIVTKYQPQNVNADAADLTFVSGTPAVATVSAAGVLTGVSNGTSVITVTHKVSGKKATLLATVSGVA